MLGWFTRCLPGISLLFFIGILLCAFTDLDEWLPLLSFNHFERTTFDYEPGNAPPSAPVRLKYSQQFFVWYSIAVHLDTILFSTRLGIALVRVRNGITKTLLRRQEQPRKSIDQFQSSPISLSRSATPVSQVSQLDSEHGSEDSASTLVGSLSADEVIHAIILPNYAEDMETLTTTLNVLASHARAPTQYEVSVPSGRVVLGTCKSIRSLSTGLSGNGTEGARIVI
jgi:hypothetical protein